MRYPLFLLLLLALPLSLRSAPSPQFTVTDIGAVPLYRGRTGGTAINDRGQVVGGNRQAFLWENGQITQLGAFPPLPSEDDSGSIAYSINNAGQIVGASGGFGPIFMSGTAVARAFLYQKGEIMPLGDHNASFEAYSINDKKQIVGLDAYRGFFYANGRVIDFGTLSNQPEGNRSQARSINNAGQVVGWTTVYEGFKPPFNYHAFLYQTSSKKNRMRDLGTLPGWKNSYAYAINASGQVTGYVSHTYPNDAMQAILWSHKKIIGLGYLTRSKTSRAFGMNNACQIVGTSDARAFLWQHSKMLDLNALIPANSGWILEEARAINNKGQIVGEGTLNSKRHAFLLTPQ